MRICVCLQLEDVSTEAHRLSRCLAQPSFPSLASTEAAGDKEEQATIQKVKLVFYPVYIFYFGQTETQGPVKLLMRDKTGSMFILLVRCCSVGVSTVI